METNTNLRPFRCKHCDMTFKQKKGLANHVKRIHSARTPVACELCGKMYVDHAQKDIHLKSVHLKETQHPCPHRGCRIAVGKRSQLKRHLQSHLPREQRQIFNCLEETCKKTFLKESTMLEHHRAFHEGKGLHCPHCDKVLICKSKLQSHILTHTLEKNFPCPQCGRLFARKRDIESHLKFVHGNEPVTRKWKCSICSKSFTITSKMNVDLHKRIHLSEEDRQKLKTFPCTHCVKSFDSLSKVKSHMYKVHTSKNSQGFPCPKCNKSFDNPKYLNKHEQTVHERRWLKSCYFCGQMTGNILQHIGTHIKEKPFKCPKCPKKFVRFSEIKRHVFVHVKMEMRKIWKCERSDNGCAAVFRSRTGMLQHVQIKHEGILRYECNLCHRRTSSMRNLESHIRVHHTNETPFRCKVKGCDYQLRTESGLRRHVKKHTNHNNKHVT